MNDVLKSGYFFLLIKIFFSNQWPFEGENFAFILAQTGGGRGGGIAPRSDGPVKGSEKVVQKGEKKKKDRKQTVSIGASIEMPVS